MKMFGNHRSIAALSAVFLSVVVLVVPVVLFLQTLAVQVIGVVTEMRGQVGPETLEQAVTQINHTISMLPFTDGFQLSSQEVVQFVVKNIAPATDWIVNSFWQIGNYSISFIVNLVLMIILIFFILPNLPELKKYIYTISPLGSEATHQYFSRAYSMLLDVLKGTFLIAVLQGLVGGVFLAVIGFPAWVLFAFLMMILSMIPVLGTGFVLVPIAIIYLLTGHPVLGVLTACWQFFVVGTIDNIVRSVVVSKETNVHPALMMLAVLGGLKAFGFLGIVYGPLIMVVFLTTLEVYRQEYH